LQTSATSTTNFLNVLIVDDEPNIRRLLGMCLEADGHRVASTGNAVDAIDAASRQSFDLAFVDLRLGTSNGLDLIPQLLAQSPWMKVVVITAYASIDTAVEATRRGALDYLPKPFTPAQVSAVVQRVAAMRRMEIEVQQLQDEVRKSGEIELASRTPAMQRAFEMARQVAGSDATVLLRGESGTGKGVLARTIHQWSARASRPFATVSCPSLSPELLESELFGHVKGAFTGAVRDNPGRVASSEGGTLFLDEIGDLPLALQPKLLRFLQEREYERVGDARTRHANVRIIAATNLDLASAVRGGRFREDLYYRLNVIQIDVPLLRDRVEDILPLAERMLASLSDGRLLGFTESAAWALRSYPWPGNLRELRNAVERAAILCKGNRIGPEHLPEAVVSPSRGAHDVRAGDMITLDELEQKHIRRVLSSTKTLDEAAAVLGIDVATLWRRRKKYGI
jgi:NtrC-family two-component system response regulator AlgB